MLTLYFAGVSTYDPERFVNGHEAHQDTVVDCIGNNLTDGMDSYFRDNLHLLHEDIVDTGASTPEASPRHESLNLEDTAVSNEDYMHMAAAPMNSVSSWNDVATMTCSSSRHSGMQSSNGYGSDKNSHRGSDDDSDEGGVYVLPDDVVVSRSNLSRRISISSDDQGDFIEADISRNGYASSDASSNSNSRKNSASSSYEDLRTSNIRPPNRSGDDETFTRLVFDNESRACGLMQTTTSSGAAASATSHHSRNISSSPEREHASAVAATRPNNLFNALADNEYIDRSNFMLTSASTESSSPFTMSSAAFMSPSYSENSTSALNAPTSESSVFISPDLENAPDNSARRRQAFLRNQSVDSGAVNHGQCPLRPAKSSGE